MALRAVAPAAATRWGMFRLSANQTTGLTVNSPIRFDTLSAGTLTLSGYAIQLPENREFRLTSGLSFSFSNNNGSVQTCWYDMTAGRFVGVTSLHSPPTNTTPWSQQPVAHAVVSTVGGARSVQLRISAASSPSGVFAAFSFAEVTEIR
ncbi:hypothetical protein AZL_021230 [Azospirillum sp. B510]|uniref:hypothetical protein n=1 Tax=Azospirillum sp. (strain B510) TaxID=137722 RepID=UPI0001C4BDDD|nr:hypothetical protein [Azospirillum sp. B510]BAI72761.1 hypothetical protein AZL_021230 [Azospirillum sp. B510]